MDNVSRYKRRIRAFLARHSSFWQMRLILVIGLLLFWSSMSPIHTLDYQSHRTTADGTECLYTDGHTLFTKRTSKFMANDDGVTFQDGLYMCYSHACKSGGLLFPPSLMFGRCRVVATMLFNIFMALIILMIAMMSCCWTHHSLIRPDRVVLLQKDTVNPTANTTANTWQRQFPITDVEMVAQGRVV